MYKEIFKYVLSNILVSTWRGYGRVIEADLGVGVTGSSIEKKCEFRSEMVHSAGYLGYKLFLYSSRFTCMAWLLCEGLFGEGGGAGWKGVHPTLQIQP